MKLRNLAVAALATSAAAFALVGPTQAGPDFKNKYENVADERDCGNENTITYFGPTKMWPPNHKMQPVSVEATDGSGDTTSLAIEVVSNQADNAKGDGNTTGDAELPQGDMASGTPTAEIPFALRSERSGLVKSGRTYTINAEAVFDNGLSQPCVQTFTVTVPHDMRDK